MLVLSREAFGTAQSLPGGLSMRRRTCLIAIALVAAGLGWDSSSPAGAPVPSQPAKPDPQVVAKSVDAGLTREVFTPAKATLAPRCDDATYLRRVWLDIAGDIPTPEHVTAFLLDKSPDKRAKVVRELLAD